MNSKRIITLCLILLFFNANLLPAFAIQNTETKNQSGLSKKQEKLLNHKVKRNKKYNDDYKYEYVNLDFWKNFNDENLNNYINLAIQKNYDLKMSTLTVDEYYQNVKLQLSNELPQAGVGFLPSLAGISGNKKLLGNTDSDWTFLTPMLISYEADIFLKNRDKTRSTKKLYEASKFDERAAYISIASAVGSIYINLVTLNEIIAYQENIVKLRKEIYEIMQESNNHGLVSTSDTVKANKSYVYGTSELIAYKKERTKLLNQLAVLIGENPENSEQLKIGSLSSLKYTKTIPQKVSSEVITNRPDYLKSIALLEKSGIDVRVAKKEFLPSITISGLASFISGSNLPVDAIYALAGSAILPVFTGGKRIANLKLRKVQYDKMLENYYKTNLTAIQEVNDALVSVKRDKEKLQEHIKQEKLETQDFGFAQQKFNQGIISKLDLIQMQENLLVVKQLVANSTGSCYIDYISLYKASGSKM